MDEKSNSKWLDELNKLALDGIIYIQSMKYIYKPIIVFDIDNTLIDLEGERINPIVTLFDFVKLLKIPIAIITTRVGTIDNIDKTQKHLYKRSIFGYSYIYFIKSLDNNLTDFQEKTRQDIKKKGFYCK